MKFLKKWTFYRLNVRLLFESGTYSRAALNGARTVYCNLYFLEYYHMQNVLHTALRLFIGKICIQVVVKRTNISIISFNEALQ